MMSNRQTRSRSRRRAWFFFAGAGALFVGYESSIVFLRRPVLRIEGEQPVRIEAFAAGATVTHAFQMRDDGLHAVSLRLVADRPVSRRVLCRLRRLDGESLADDENRYGDVYRWTDKLAIDAGDHWHTIGFQSVGKSAGQWYTFEIQLLGAPGSADVAQTQIAAVSLMASADNPPAGGKLWVDHVRQPGSLFLRAHGGTTYERFRLRVEPKLPGVLRNRIAQALAVLIYHWALFTCAYGLVFGVEAAH